MSITSHNKKLNSIEWGYDTKDFEFKKCSEVELDTPLKIHGVFITSDNGYGEGACAILDDSILNMPARFVPIVRDILDDQEAIAEINEGRAGIKVSTFISKKYKRTGYDIEFLEMK